MTFRKTQGEKAALRTTHKE